MKGIGKKEALEIQLRLWDIWSSLRGMHESARVPLKADAVAAGALNDLHCLDLLGFLLLQPVFPRGPCTAQYQLLPNSVWGLLVDSGFPAAPLLWLRLVSFT